jgi:ankyrin repeat protein
MTLLHHVAFAGNLEAIHEIAKLPYFGEVVDENANEEGWTPLLWAATKKHMAVARVLVEEGGANVLKPKADGMTPLHVAASQNDIHFLDFVLSRTDSSAVNL